MFLSILRSTCDQQSILLVNVNTLLKPFVIAFAESATKTVGLYSYEHTLAANSCTVRNKKA